MSDKEILQAIDKLDMELPFDEIYVGDKYVDVHELITEIKERLAWHYPSEGDYPTEYGNYFVIYECAGAMVRSIKFYDTRSKKFDITLPVIAWMPLPSLPKEEE